MKLKSLAAAVALLQMGAIVLPTAVAFADDHGRGHREWDGDDDRGGDHWRGRDHDRQEWRGNDYGRDDRRDYNREYRRDYRPSEARFRGWDRPDHDDDRGHYRGRGGLPFYHGPDYYAPEGRIRRYHDMTIVRPYGHWYSGYGHYRHDDNALPFLAFAAISLVALNMLSENQQRMHEDAQIRATEAPIGSPIRWNDGNAYGTVTATNEGRDQDGRYCREFQQNVNVRGRPSSAYGTACRQPDGTWQIVSTN